MQAHVVNLEKSMKESLEADNDEYHQISEELEGARQMLESLRRHVKAKEKVLGKLNPRKLANLKGANICVYA